MKNYKYYPPETKPHWTDHIFKYFDWYKLVVYFILSLGLIWFWVMVWSWVSTILNNRPLY